MELASGHEDSLIPSERLMLANSVGFKCHRRIITAQSLINWECWSEIGRANWCLSVCECVNDRWVSGRLPISTGSLIPEGEKNPQPSPPPPLSHTDSESSSALEAYES